jgi:hypothetical protein
MATREQKIKNTKIQKCKNKNIKAANIKKKTITNLKMLLFEGFTHPYTLPSKGEIDPQFP